MDWSQYRAPTIEEVKERRLEEHDREFWKRRAKTLETELKLTERVLGELAGLRDAQYQIPEWVFKAKPGKGKSVVGAHLTDLHMGEVVEPSEILNLNEFNPAIAKRRVERFAEAVSVVGHRWGSDTEILGALVLLGGDMIAGDIHLELSMTNALTSTESVVDAVEVCCAFIRTQLKAFGKVHVGCVPGNHGRTTHKPHSKMYARLSYDTLIYKLVAEQFKGNPNVTFQIASGRDVIVPLFNRRIFLTHGDGMGTGGGQGFIGPMAPIVRGTKKVAAQQAQADRNVDLIVHGHYHTSGNPPGVLAGGSIPGYTEYGNGLRAALEPPQQWAFLLHSKWWLRERDEIKLEDPVKPERVRVRVPAGWSEA